MRYHSIEMLRGIAAVAVAWFHFVNPLSYEWLRLTGAYGHFGVEVFFVISGFVVPYSMRAGKPFLSRRLLRLWPPFAASLILVIGLWQLSAATPGFAGRVPEFAILENAFYLAGILNVEWMSPVYWTLAVEVQFYCLAALFFKLALARGDVAWRACLLAMIGTSFIPIEGNVWAIPFLGYFALGGAVFSVMTRHDRWGFPIAAIAVISIAFTWTLAHAAVGLAAGLFIWLYRWPAPRALIWLGTVSYSLYLVHYPVGARLMSIGGKRIDNGFEALALALLALFVSLIVAHVFYLLAERPAIHMSRVNPARAATARSPRA